MTKPILIISALKKEISMFLHSLTMYKNLSFDSVELIEGYYKQVYILVLISGIGKKNTEINLSKVLNRYSVSAIMSIGISGGISDKLKFNDLIIQKAVYFISQKNSLIAIPISHLVIKKISSIFDRHNINYKVRNGLTLKSPLLKSSDKIELSSYPVSLVDMESYVIAELAKEKKVPFISIRTIFDTLTENLINFHNFIDNKSNVKLTKLIKQIIKKPLLIKELLRLSIKIKKAEKKINFIIKTTIPFLKA